MSGFALLSAACLLLLAGAHSVLGERLVLAPLFAAEWREPAPRWAMERLLRFAWHLTSMAWVALAAVLVGAPVGASVAVLGLSSAAVVFVMLRGHLSWPLFLGVGIGGLALSGALVAPLLWACVGVTVLALAVVAGVHVYWASGGRKGLSAALPAQVDGTRLFRPPAWASSGVAVALALLAGLVLWTATGLAPDWARVLVGLAGVGMLARAAGDGRYVGLSKTVRGTEFSMWDDALFNPLVVLFALGSGAALLVG